MMGMLRRARMGAGTTNGANANNNDDDVLSLSSSNYQDEDPSAGMLDDTMRDSSVHPHPEGNENKDTANPAIAKRETKAVCGVRMLVFGVLLCSMTAVAVLVFYALRNSEQDSFEQQFYENADKILASLGLSLDLTLGGLDALVVNMVSEAKKTNQTWPFVTIPDFAVRAEKTRSLTNALYLNIYANVESHQRQEWQDYCAQHGRHWVDETIRVQQLEGIFTDAVNVPTWNVIWDYSEFDKNESEWGTVGLDPSDPGPFMPMWHISPVVATPSEPAYNWDLLSVVYNESAVAVRETHKVSLTDAYMIAYPDDLESLEQIEYDAEWFQAFITTGEEPREPMSDVHYPILAHGSSRIHLMKDPDTYNPADHQLGGFLTAPIYWRDLIRGILPEGSNGMVTVFDSPCNPSFTYEINGPTVKYMGTGDHHETRFDYMEQSSSIHDLDSYSPRGSQYSGIPINEDVCPFTIRIYPSSTMEDSYLTSQPIVITVVVGLIFIVTSAVFVVYDFCVEKRQRVVMSSAVRSNAIVSSLFPSTFRDRLMKQQEQQEQHPGNNHNSNKHNQSGNSSERNPLTMTSYDATHGDDTQLNGQPLADLFPEATILFADLSGFTAWSSSREPTQVFTLLETLYGAFDKIGERRGVFKVETVGDCYVAVAGVPTPRKHHAVVMCRFAGEIRQVTNQLTTELELTLGPGTSDLTLRCGLNSGSVTAGVLRGQKSRFQLFGDTVNTAARMESNGTPNRIQISQKTAELLIAAGKGAWLTKREELVDVKGKGLMQTYWVEPKGHPQSRASEVSEENDITTGADSPDPIVESSMYPSAQAALEDDFPSSVDGRLVDWSVSVLEGLFRKLSAHRQALRDSNSANADMTGGSALSLSTGATTFPREEVVESIDLPSFQKKSVEVDPSDMELPPVVVQQLRAYISTIALMYRPNAFHNFAHACHVTMSTKKLLQRITTHSHTLSQQEIYFHSFGLGSDPLTEVAMIFSALIHDVEHPGVSNSQLAQEDHAMAVRYHNKSAAEQNSVDAAWSVLFDPVYGELRSFLFTSQQELERFRQLVVNAVMATDVFDPELKAMRDRRWELAFSESAQSNDPDALHRKATIVLEHLIQASDVSHTMQHWTIYQKWNRNLFQERYGAYKEGRVASDPSERWYQGELWFFDNYIIPLAKKLNDCHVFGVCCQEMLDCAYENRLEWENKGQEIAREMKASMDAAARQTQKGGSPPPTPKTK